MQIAVIGSLVVFILLFRLWPVSTSVYLDFDGNNHLMEDLDSRFLFTQQEPQVMRSAPPVPRPEAVHPDDEIVDEEFDLEADDFSWLEESATFESASGEGEIFNEPDRLPSVRRIVEPVMPSQARADELRAEVYVRFLVSDTGETEHVEIDEILVFHSESGTYIPTDDPGYNLTEVVLRAARQWQFQPAIHQGREVRSWARYRFTFSP
ncbi:hypothetical protein QLX67_02810 [Balneolaceae bacterium ANBcel3]|nr:hypothetical protein [Balneolaceae bacterium ANBcel3]